MVACNGDLKSSNWLRSSKTSRDETSTCSAFLRARDLLSSSFVVSTVHDQERAGSEEPDQQAVLPKVVNNLLRIRNSHFLHLLEGQAKGLKMACQEETLHSASY